MARNVAYDFSGKLLMSYWLKENWTKILCFLFLVLFAVGAHRVQHSGMNGRWEKVSGDSAAPSEMSVRVRDGEFTVHMRSGDYFHLTLDGMEHVYTDNPRVNYVARGDSSRIQILRKYAWKWLPADLRKQVPEILETEYFLRDQDRTLVLAEFGRETIYRRSSLWRTLTIGGF